MTFDQSGQTMLAPGSPPLTLETANTFMEILAFVDAVMDNRPPTPLAESIRATLVQQLAARYPGLGAFQQQWLSMLPAEWEQTKLIWSSASADVRAVLSQQLVMGFGAIVQSMPVFASPFAPQDAVQSPIMAPAASPTPGPLPPPPTPAAQPNSDQIFAEIRADQLRKEAEARQTSPELAMQVQLQNQLANTTLMTNMLNMQHEASMAIIRNIH